MALGAAVRRAEDDRAARDGAGLLGVVLGLGGAYVLTKYLESRMNLSSMLLWREADRPADLWRDCGVVDVGRADCLLCPGAAGDESRPDGGAAM